jgi:hypothetical protein
VLRLKRKSFLKKALIILGCILAIILIAIAAMYITAGKKTAYYKNFDFGSLNLSAVKDGTYTGGNIIYINPDALSKCYSIAERLVNTRKNPLSMGRAVGLWILIKLCLGRLSIDSVEKRAGKLFGINARAIKTLYPEIGNDVDKPDDVEFVSKYIHHSL